MNWYSTPLTTLGDGVLDLAIEYIKENVDPEDVFADAKLEEWAEANGYTKDDDDS